MDSNLSSVSRSKVVKRQVNLSDSSSSEDGNEGEDECEKSLGTTINCESDSDGDVETTLRGDSRRNQSLTMTNNHPSTTARPVMNYSLPVPTDNPNYTPKCNFNLLPSAQKPDVIFNQACRLNSLSGQMRLIKQQMVQQRNQHTEVMQALMRGSDHQWQETRFQNNNIKQTLDELRILREATEVQFSTISARLNQVESSQQSNSNQTKRLSEQQEELRSEMASISNDLRENVTSLEMIHGKAARSFEANSKNTEVKIKEVNDHIKLQSIRLNQIENLLKQSASLNTGVENQTVSAGESKSLRSRSRKIHDADGHLSSLETEPEPAAGPRPKKQKTGKSKSKQGTSSELSVVAEAETASVAEAEPLRSVSMRTRSECTYCGRDLVSTYLKQHMRFTCPVLRKQRLAMGIPAGGNSNSAELSSEMNSVAEAMNVDVPYATTQQGLRSRPVRLRPNYHQVLN